MKNMEEKMPIEDFRSALFGARVVNAEIVKFLWWEVYYHAARAGNDELMEKMDNGTAYRFDQFINIAMLLYQVKFWYDHKCRETKAKHSFNKSAREFRDEMPWLSEKAISRHLKLLNELGLISREPGLYIANQKKYTYKLNIYHPLIMQIYLLEGAYKYFQKQDKKIATEAIVIEMQDMEVRAFAPYIENQVVRTLYTVPNFRMDIMSFPYGHYMHTVWTLCPYREDTISPLTDTCSGTCSDTKTNNTPHSSAARKQNSPEVNSSGFALESMGSETKQFSAAAVPVVQQAQMKLNEMDSKQVEKVRKLHIPSWRKNGRRKFYQHQQQYDDAREWYKNLDADSKRIVEMFQGAMYSDKSKIKEETSHDISLIDAQSQAENFLQFVIKNELVDCT